MSSKPQAQAQTQVQTQPQGAVNVAASSNSPTLDWKFQQVFGDAKSEEAIEGTLHSFAHSAQPILHVVRFFFFQLPTLSPALNMTPPVITLQLVTEAVVS